MAKLELTNDEINEILEYLDGCAVDVMIRLKLASAAGAVLGEFWDNPEELLERVLEELTADNQRVLMNYAIDLYDQQSNN